MKNNIDFFRNKAITFSFDDGVTQDIRLIEILNKYGLKATFNLNSALLGLPKTLEISGKSISHNKVQAKDVAQIYKGHEIAVHTLTHPNLTTLDEATIIYQTETDRKMLSDIAGYEVVGMAYPCGGVNNDDRVAEIIKNHTGIKYARTIAPTYQFETQDNLFRFNPSIHFIDKRLEEIVDSFLALDTATPKLLYIWGHSYELDTDYISWEFFERICKKVSNQKDIFYGTNREILL
jgi:peptidoglycan/xylan/chitin deacetylase (PgdA/CDA1 family)